MSVLLGDGAGGFSPRTDFATGFGPIAVAIGDMNGDGHIDLVTANDYADTVSVLLGDGAGAFGPKIDSALDLEPYGVALGDLDGDTNLDIVGISGVGVEATVRLGDGAGGFRSTAGYNVAGSPWSVTLVDVNDNATLDVITSNSGAVSVGLGDGTGGFACRGSITLLEPVEEMRRWAISTEMRSSIWPPLTTLGTRCRCSSGMAPEGSALRSPNRPATGRSRRRSVI